MQDEVMRAIRSARRPVVVFDVDSTLVSTAGRHLAILRAFAEGRPALRELAARLAPEDFGWTVDAPVRARMDLDPETASALQAFWADAFFSDRFLAHDRPVPGAVDFVRRVHSAGAWVVYLTARAADRMGARTAETLVSMGFPVVEGRATLHLKPSSDTSDHGHKASALAEAAWLGEVVATFENEPANANLFARSFPGGLHVLVGSLCSPGAPDPDPTVLRVDGFA
ncbi:MAG: hypothetical protein KC656_36035 [Myxococcales bacterium]|nr:hypothetical protein [Myxococcales bacterium]MCB9694832.1 hypothetical protein [Alphaproteobacteria bacterium]